ncbi:hypothetical protein [Tessaracoccus oleiagri]|uniref:Uncharacterized protein n=1 Tax=Tessaracoccus oleiagri TaxID=686624 RepID=A0A1G9HR64_9ACTN|nr:hypothetical protein [Tessaracoccus oleiagri]SDL15448.1 hypothetical protein SAMN04488242_0476 [Tessaracoccus oleiagri]
MTVLAHDEQRAAPLRVPTAMTVAVVPLVAVFTWAVVAAGRVWPEMAWYWTVLVIGLALGWAAIYYFVDVRRHWPLLVAGQWASVVLFVWAVPAATGDDLLGGAALGWAGGLWWGSWAMVGWMVPVAVLHTALRSRSNAGSA